MSTAINPDTDQDNTLGDATAVEQVDATEATPTETSTCRYSSKPCSNPRAVKKTGDLHSFCEFHRLMANRNQRRCEQKRRTKRQLEKAVQKRGVAPGTYQPHMGLGVAPTPSVVAENKYKRRRSSAQSASPTSIDATPVVVSVPLIDTHSHELQHKPKCIDPMGFCAENAFSLEPYTHPVPLREEDLQYLFMTVVDSTYVHALDPSVIVDSKHTFVV